MATKLDELKWYLFLKRERSMTIHGLKNGLISPYDDEMIERFRNVYYGGLPASIILLSHTMTNGYCYDKALLAARAFLDDKNIDVNLLYLSVDFLRLNPNSLNDKDPLYSDHCVAEIILDTGKAFIIDTTAGFIYDKSYYWKIQKPKIRHTNNKESIKQFLAEDFEPYDIERDKYAASLILDNIESAFVESREFYAESLQKEILRYKSIIGYDSIKQELFKHRTSAPSKTKNTFPYNHSPKNRIIAKEEPSSSTPNNVSGRCDDANVDR